MLIMPSTSLRVWCPWLGIINVPSFSLYTNLEAILFRYSINSSFWLWGKWFILEIFLDVKITLLALENHAPQVLTLPIFLVSIGFFVGQSRKWSIEA